MTEFNNENEFENEEESFETNDSSTVIQGEKQEDLDPKEKKSFSQEELDRIISKRLEKAQKKWEQESSRQIEELKISTMSPNEKKEYEKNKLDQALTEREMSILRRELRADASEQLLKEGLPKKLVDIVDTSSEENMIKSIDTIREVIQESVTQVVNEKLRGKSTPRASTQTKMGDTDAFLKGLRGK